MGSCVLYSKPTNMKFMILLLLLSISVVMSEDRKYQYMGLLQNIVEPPLKVVPCNASVGRDLECSLACGQHVECGAFFVRNSTGMKHGACVMISMDQDGKYKDPQNPDIVNGTSNYWYRI